jgi:hypothetical protein
MTSGPPVTPGTTTITDEFMGTVSQENQIRPKRHISTRRKCRTGPAPHLGPFMGENVLL